jgi:hypothetical protein
MSNLEKMGRTAAWRFGKGAASITLAAAVLAGGAGPAGAHGGDTAKVHSCIIASSGVPKIIAADASCDKNELAFDWSAVDTNTTYSAGSGLSLSAGNVFSVTGAPWSGLTGVPAGFRDGVDDVGESVDMKSDDRSAPKEPNDNDGFVHWNNLEGVPNAILDGGGSAAVDQLKSDLADADGTPNESSDLVSFSKIKDLTGRITGAFIQDWAITRDHLRHGSVDTLQIQDGSIGGVDIQPRTVFGGNIYFETINDTNLEGRYGDRDGDFSTLEEVRPGAVTGEKIRDESVESRDISDGTVNSGDIATNTITLDDLAAHAVDSAVIRDAEVRAPDLAGDDEDSDPAAPGMQPIAGAVTSEKVRDESVQSRDIRDGAVSSADIATNTITVDDLAARAVDSAVIRDGEVRVSDLAGDDGDSHPNMPGVQSITGAVTSEKIADGQVASRDLAPGVLDRYTSRVSVDPATIEPGSRAAVTIPSPHVRPGDLVTVSPPAGLAEDLIFAGSREALGQGEVIVYLYNASGDAIDDTAQTWTIQGLRTGG